MADELVGVVIANAESREELTASRARVVAAGDDARRRIQRDLHGGAQQRLVSTVLALKMARQELGDEAGSAAELLDEALAHAERALGELRELAHGIRPAALSRGRCAPGSTRSSRAPTASAAHGATGPGCSASATAPPRWTARLTSRALRAGGPWLPPRSRSRAHRPCHGCAEPRSPWTQNAERPAPWPAARCPVRLAAATDQSSVAGGHSVLTRFST